MLEGVLRLLCGGDVEDVLQWGLLGEGWMKPASSLDAMRNSSAESSIMAHRWVDDPPWGRWPFIAPPG
jgi:hypothetical protein